MVKFLMIRHGQSEANATRRFAGHWDSPATELGLYQAKLVGQYVAQHYKIDAIYSSDLSRAAAVGNAVAEATGLTVQPDVRLREINAGQWEGLTFEQLIANFPGFHIWRTDLGNAYCDGGESVAQLQERIIDRLKEIAKDHDGQTVVIATHATPIRVTQCYAEGRPLQELSQLSWVSNASVTEMDYDGAFHIVKLGYDGYLGESVSRLPANV